MAFHRQPHTYVSHVSLKVKDLERSLSFYKEIIGLQILENDGREAVLTADGRTPLLTMKQPKNVTPKQAKTTGLYHYALLLPSRAALADILQHFIQQKVPLGASDHLVSEALYLNDPDGNGIEIYADRSSSTWEWQDGEVVMATEPLDAESLLAEGTGKPWEDLPANTIMGHVHLHVSDLEQASKFYKEGLGFDIVRHYHQALFMSTGGVSPSYCHQYVAWRWRACPCTK